jgi:hypothetical protein
MPSCSIIAFAGAGAAGGMTGVIVSKGLPSNSAIISALSCDSETGGNGTA